MVVFSTAALQKRQRLKGFGRGAQEEFGIGIP